MEKFVGIDFGACNIKAAYWWHGKEVRIARLSQDVEQSYIPNVVLYYMTQAGNLEKKIGDPAKEEQDPENSVEYVKRKLEIETWAKPIPNLQRDVTAMEAATDIFRGLSERLQKKLNCAAHELQAVITVPVCSSGLQRSRIYQAARAAGIGVEAVITEPFAAVFAFDDVFDGDGKDENVLVFDFGGSTLDLSLLQVEREGGIRLEELASAGLPFGGIDIDEAIFSEILEKKYASEIAEIQSNDDTIGKSKTEQELRDVATKMKENLFAEDNEFFKRTFTFHGSGTSYTFELTRNEMEALFQRHGLREKIFGLLDELFGQTYLQKTEVTLVKPVGGASRIKYVLDLLTEYFGADIFDSDDIFDDDKYDWDEKMADVAAGAAQYLAICKEQNEGIEIVSTVPFSLGIANGEVFKKYLECCPPYGRRTKRIPLPWNRLAETEYKVSVYQSFADSEQVAIGGKNGAVYVGSVTVDPALYQANDGILLEMEMADSDTLRMIFSEMRDDDLQDVETKEIHIGVVENG